MSGLRETHESEWLIVDDREFFDTLMQLFMKTTFAEKRYWDYQGDGEGGFDVNAVGEGDEREFVGYLDKEPDADFITALHGCFPDLYRRLHSALDEADRADRDKDERECRIAELEIEVAALRKELLTA